MGLALLERQEAIRPEGEAIGVDGYLLHGLGGAPEDHCGRLAAMNAYNERDARALSGMGVRAEGMHRRRVETWTDDWLGKCTPVWGVVVILSITEQSPVVSGVEGASDGDGRVGGGEMQLGEYVAGQEPCPSGQHQPERPALRNVAHE